MCEPTLIMATSLAIGVGTSIAGGYMQADAAKAQAAMAAESQNLAAAADRSKGDNERIAGQYEARRAQEKAQRLQAQQVTQVASTGILLDEGTPVDLIIDSAREADLDRQAIEYRANLNAHTQYQSAAIHTFNAAQELEAGKVKARNAIIGGYIGALGKVASVGTSDFMMNKFTGKTTSTAKVATE